LDSHSTILIGSSLPPPSAATLSAIPRMAIAALNKLAIKTLT
jgi:hypothetical protein